MDWFVADVAAKAEVLDLEISSLVEWLLVTDASWNIVPFFTRLEPAVVETFHTSYTSQKKIRLKFIRWSHWHLKAVNLNKPAAVESLVPLPGRNIPTSFCTLSLSNISLKGRSQPAKWDSNLFWENLNAISQEKLDTLGLGTKGAQLLIKYVVQLIFQTSNWRNNKNNVHILKHITNLFCSLKKFKFNMQYAPTLNYKFIFAT